MDVECVEHGRERDVITDSIGQLDNWFGVVRLRGSPDGPKEAGYEEGDYSFRYELKIPQHWTIYLGGPIYDKFESVTGDETGAG